MKEANTTAQPQPPSGGGTESASPGVPPASPWAWPLVFTSDALGDFSRGGEALTGISLESTRLLVLTGSWLSGPAILESEPVFKVSLVSVMNVSPGTQIFIAPHWMLISGLLIIAILHTPIKGCFIFSTAVFSHNLRSGLYWCVTARLTSHQHRCPCLCSVSEYYNVWQRKCAKHIDQWS